MIIFYPMREEDFYNCEIKYKALIINKNLNSNYPKIIFGFHKIK